MKKKLTIAQGDHVISNIHKARGCIAAQHDKHRDVCRVDARIAELKPSEQSDELLNRLGELLIAEFPNNLKAATFANDNILVAWVVVPASSKKGGPQRQIDRLVTVLSGAGFRGTLIGSVIKKGGSKVH